MSAPRTRAQREKANKLAKIQREAQRIDQRAWPSVVAPSEQPTRLEDFGPHPEWRYHLDLAKNDPRRRRA